MNIGITIGLFVLCFVAVWAVQRHHRTRLVHDQRRTSPRQPQASRSTAAVSFVPATSAAPAANGCSSAAPTAPELRGRYALRSTIMTEAETTFLRVLLKAVPEGTLVLAQVRLTALVTTCQRGEPGKYDFYRIQAKSVDYVICNQATTAPLLVIELDDVSHQRTDRQQRDALLDTILADVGLPILHVPWQRTYDGLALAAQINAKLGRVGATLTLSG